VYKRRRAAEKEEAVRRFLLLIATATMIPATAVPAYAQDTPGQEESGSQTVVVTGLIERPEITTYMYGSHAVTDEASGTRYALRSEEEELLDGYTGRRATVYGTSVPEYEGGAVEGGPPLLNVTRVEPAGSPDPTDPELGVDLNGDGKVDEADGRLAAEISDAAMSAASKLGRPALPPTGGPQLPLEPAALLLSALLTAGLLARRILR
jgi:hypothetical protein